MSGRLDLAAEDREREEFEGAIESWFDDLGITGVEREEERLENGICILRGESGDDGGRIVKVVGKRFEFVENGFTGGDEIRVLTPRRVFDDLV